jgi:hypothetical protein
LLYGLGIFGILATGGSSDDDDDSVDCIIDVVSDIESTIDGTNDIWVTADGLGDPATIVVARLRSNGSEVSVFTVGTGLADRANAIAVAADGTGDLYVGGNFEKGILRLNSDASLDPGFAVGSGFTWSFGDMSVQSIVPAADGSGDIYVAGTFDTYDSNPTHGIVRLNADGSLDAVFDATSVGQGFSAALAADGSGRIYSSDVDGAPGDRGVGRLNIDGSQDMGFTVFPSDFANMVITPAVDFTDDVYIGWGHAPALIRVDFSGATDSDFDIGTGFSGSLTPDLTNPFVRSIEPVAFSAGAIYVGGDFTAYDGNAANGIVRLNNDGSQDFNFMIGSGFNAAPTVITSALDGSSDIYVGGHFGWPTRGYNGAPVTGIVRLKADGSLDTSFTPGITFDGNVCTNQL